MVIFSFSDPALGQGLTAISEAATRRKDGVLLSQPTNRRCERYTPENKRLEPENNPLEKEKQ